MAAKVKKQLKQARNAYKVPARQWTRWDRQSRRTFNEVYGTMRLNQSVFLHPKTSPIPRDQWKTICWNAAWIAADAAKTA